ncbi:diguanylate cyclase domain-containing protein [Vibrio bivalvicida]|uniref:Diguanylate cyclase domain-containing protein n=1 Tax=Vibrio bivalvicida TaxID=1276888 RepID=A0ABV4ME05_9VIBR
MGKLGLIWQTNLLIFCVLFTPVALSGAAYKVGIEADDFVTRTLFDAVSERFGFQVEYVYYPSFSDILFAVKHGQADFAANVTFTPERAEYFDFSSPTNIEFTYLYSSHNATLESANVIGIPEGTIYGELIAVNYPHITQIVYTGHEQAKALLEAKKVDGIVDAINQLKPMLLAGYDAQLLNNQLSIKPVSIIAPKHVHRDLLTSIEAYIHSAEIQKRLRQSVKQYQFELRQQALRQSVIDSNLNLNRTYKVKLEHVGQYAMYHNNGQVTGISADVVKQACEILLLKCQVVSGAYETWESMYQDFVAKRIDIIAPLIVSESRKQIAEFSDPYYFPEVVMIKREGYKDAVYSNVSELIVEDIGVLKDDFYAELLAQLLPNKELKSFATSQQMYTALLGGEIDYMATSQASFNKKLRESSDLLPLEEDQMIGSFYRSDVAIGLAKNEVGASLAPLFTRAIKMLDTASIIERYDYQPNWRATLQAEQAFSRKSNILFVMVIGFMLIVSLYLHSQSNTDPLTRLKNRRSMHQRFISGVNADLTVIYLDVNRFKHINDTYGHEVGDQVLTSVATHIEKVWKGRCYRIGGDEFILVGKAKKQSVCNVLDKLQVVPFVSQDQQLSFDVSIAIGLSLPRRTFMSLQEVLNEADEAMYQHKQQSKQSANEDLNDDKNVLYFN